MASSVIASMWLAAAQTHIFIVLFSLGMWMLMYARNIHDTDLVSQPAYRPDVAYLGPPRE